MNDRPVAAFSLWKASEEKLDYFITAVSAALAAYLGKSIVVSSPVDLAQSLELIAAAAFVASFIAAIKRLEFNNSAMSATYRRLENEVRAGRRVDESKHDIAIDPVTSTLQTSEDLIEEGKAHRIEAQHQSVIESSMQSKASAAYEWRNRLLIAGFLALAASRLVPLFSAIVDEIRSRSAA